MHPPARRVAAALLVAVVLLAALAARVAADAPPTVTVAATDASHYPVVTTVLTAERGGVPLQPADIEQLVVSDAGRPVDVRSVRTATDARLPLAVVIALDTSGSMRGATLERAVAAADGLVARLAPGDAVAVVAFGSTVQLLQPLTTDHDAARRAIAPVEPTGNTRLFEGAATAIEIAAGASQQRRVVVLLSDGEEFGSGGAISRADSVARARSSGVVVFSVGVGPEVDAAFLGEVAAVSGGRYYAGSSTEIAPIYQQLESLMRGQLVLELVTPHAADGAGHALQIELVTREGATTTTATYVGPPPAAVPPTLEPTPAPAPRSPDAAPVSMHVTGRALAAGLGVALAALVGWQLRQAVRRRRAARGLVQVRHAHTRIELPDAATAPRATGTLEVVAGHAGASPLVVTSAPVVLGSAPGPGLALPGEGIAPRHVRVWTRDGRLMVHQLDASALTLVNGRHVEWGSLAPGGELTLGGVTLRFALAEAFGPDQTAGVAVASHAASLQP